MDRTVSVLPLEEVQDAGEYNGSWKIVAWGKSCNPHEAPCICKAGGYVTKQTKQWHK